ncbi:hypothetical protein BJ085DRAFT_31691 [Dimargaris cristalligena]|uniref:Uncharacterized protein n=1 Tax=Dimargaris cristalligena TaxID=215637 RepID=A0A4P9ZPT3_9FUNG|nr:hypothetical protein BJ085DRAFT_31691 [Dimargaris cristalligena]|eukprot:RKP35363.1 hypothetical protein BJ085DRAFT_31691 [Dimargaris cristalligena]
MYYIGTFAATVLLALVATPISLAQPMTGHVGQTSLPVPTSHIYRRQPSPAFSFPPPSSRMPGAWVDKKKETPKAGGTNVSSPKSLKPTVVNKQKTSSSTVFSTAKNVMPKVNDYEKKIIKK